MKGAGGPRQIEESPFGADWVRDEKFDNFRAVATQIFLNNRIRNSVCFLIEKWDGIE